MDLCMGLGLGCCGTVVGRGRAWSGLDLCMVGAPLRAELRRLILRYMPARTQGMTKTMTETMLAV